MAVMHKQSVNSSQLPNMHGSIFGARGARAGAGFIGVAIFLLVWWLLAEVLPRHPVVLVPTPLSVFHAFWRNRGQLGADVTASAAEAFGGWAIGSLAAILLGLVAGQVRVVRNTVVPVVEVLRPISPIAWAPLGIVWFGAGYTSKAFLVALISFFMLIVNVLHGATTVPPLLTRAADMLGINGVRRFLRVTLMSAVPDILTGLRLGLAAAWGGVIVAEIVAGQGTTGLGALELYAEQAYDVPTVILGMVIIAVLGFLFNAAFVRLERRLFPWAIESRKAD